MADISIASVIFGVTALLVISILVLLLLRHYLPLRSTPAFLLIPVFLALALPCSIIILVPVDLASAENEELGDHSTGIWLPQEVVQTTWRITYWLTFVLTWVILPVLGEYCDSGDRDIKGRILYSLRTNARYQLITIGVAIGGYVYFVFENGFKTSSLRGLVMAFAYAWGLFLAIGLMGHGLVTLPRRLFKNANVSERLKHIQGRAPGIKEKLEEAIEELEVQEHTVMQLRQRKTGISKDMQDWIEELADTCVLPEQRPGHVQPPRINNISIPAIVTERYLAELTRKLKRARHKRARFSDEWLNLCQAAQDTQDILDSASTRKLEFTKAISGRPSLKLLDAKTRFYIHTYAIPWSSLGFSAFLALASVSIVWSEVTAAFMPKLSIIGLTTLPSIDGRFAVINQLIAAAWLLYMCATALYALSDVKVWGNRALVRRQTYGESACWYALQVAKLTVPLSYNFITMMPARDVYHNTGFYTLLGQFVDLTPLGKGFSLFFPCFIVITSLASLFNLYGKLKNVLGFGILEDDEESGRIKFGSGSWREGRTLIERELQTQGTRNIVGLSDRGESLDLERDATRQRLLDQPRQHQSPTAHPPAQRTFNATTNEEEEWDESPRHFYQDLGERIRNTIDTVETPQWIKNIGGGLKTPKWMQRDQRDDTGEPGLARWFGGRQEDGRVRL